MLARPAIVRCASRNDENKFEARGIWRNPQPSNPARLGPSTRSSNRGLLSSPTPATSGPQVLGHARAVPPFIHPEIVAPACIVGAIGCTPRTLRTLDLFSNSEMLRTFVGAQVHSRNRLTGGGTQCLSRPLVIADGVLVYRILRANSLASRRLDPGIDGCRVRFLVRSTLAS